MGYGASSSESTIPKRQLRKRRVKCFKCDHRFWGRVFFCDHEKGCPKRQKEPTREQKKHLERIRKKPDVIVNDGGVHRDNSEDESIPYYKRKNWKVVKRDGA